MTKQYQTKRSGASDSLELAVPERVSVVMADVAADMREGLLAFAVGAGLQVMSALMEADVAAVAGPRGKHDAERVAVRHGTGTGSVTWVGAGSVYCVPGCVRWTDLVSFRCRPTSCSPPPRSSGGW